MLHHFFARRYLFSPKSRSVINLISGLSVVAVAMPVAAMIILLAVFNGFESLVSENFSTFDADLTVSPRKGQTFRCEEADTAALRRVEGVGAMSFILEQSALLECNSRQATALVRGGDAHYGEVFDWEETVAVGYPDLRVGDLHRLVIGQAMSYMLGIRALNDSRVRLYSVRRTPFSSLLPMENFSRRELPVGGIFTVDLDSERQYVLTSLEFAQELFSHPDRASSLVIRTTRAPQEVQREVQRALGDEFRVLTREELRASTYRIMRYEKWGIFFITLLVLVVASFSVVGALAMLIVEKKDDVATLRALGADRGFVCAVFRSEGWLICACGGALGLVLGIALTLVQQHFGIIEIPADTFLTKSYPVKLMWGDIAVVVAAFAAVAAVLSHLTVRSMIKKNI